MRVSAIGISRVCAVALCMVICFSLASVAQNGEPPVISLRGVNEAFMQYEPGYCDENGDCYPIYWHGIGWDCGTPFEPMSARAHDPVYDVDVTARMVITGSETVDAYTLGLYTVVYRVTTEDGRSATTHLYVNVIDDTAPLINLHSLGGISGVQRIYDDWPAALDPNWEEPDWVADLRGELSPFPRLLDPFTYRLHEDEPIWNDDTAMPWLCTNEVYTERLDVEDRCEGAFPESKIDTNVLVIINHVHMAEAEDYADGEESLFWVGTVGELKEARLLLLYGRPDLIGLKNPYYGFRIYYFVWDDANNMGFAMRHVNPRSGVYLGMRMPLEFTVRCDAADLSALVTEVELAEAGDFAGSVCVGNLSHLIQRTGTLDLPRDIYGYLVPGVYYLQYHVQGWFTWPRNATRTIYVEDTEPLIDLFDAMGNPVGDALTVNWCAFLAYPGATLEAQAENWAADWWPLHPNFYPFGGTRGGYGARHSCGDDMTLTGWIQQTGANQIKNAMVQFAKSGGRSPRNEVYYLAHTLVDARNNQAPVRARAVTVSYMPPQMYVLVNGQMVPEDAFFADKTYQCGQRILPEDLPVQAQIEAGMCTSVPLIPATLTNTGGLNLNSPEVGEYTITYSSSMGLARTRIVRVEDKTPPEVSLGALSADRGVTLNEGVYEINCFAQVQDVYSGADSCAGYVMVDRWIWRLREGREIVRNQNGPVDYSANNRYQDDPGEYLFVYMARDRAGNRSWSGNLDALGRPMLLESEVLDLNGNVRPGYASFVRRVRVASSFALVDEDEDGNSVFDCGVDNWQSQLETVVNPLCSSAQVSYRIWRVLSDGGVELDVNNNPVDYTMIQDGYVDGGFLVVFSAEMDGRVQPPTTRRQAWLPPIPWVLDSSGRPLDLGAPYLRYISVRDEQPPTLAVTGATRIDHVCRAPFVEPGVTVADNCTRDISPVVRNDLAPGEAGVMAVAFALNEQFRVIRDGNVPRRVAYNQFADRPGTWLLVYIAFDEAGNSTPALRGGDINSVLDSTILDEDGNILVDFARVVAVDGAPEIRLANAPTVFECGSAIVLSPTAVACGQNITSEIQFTLTGEGGSVYTFEGIRQRPGSYTVVYTLPETWGNVAPVSHAFTVVDSSAPVLTLGDIPEADQDDALGVWVIDCGAEWTDVYSALDACEGDVTEEVVRSFWRVSATGTGQVLAPVTIDDMRETGVVGDEFVAVYSIAYTLSAYEDGEFSVTPELDDFDGLPLAFYVDAEMEIIELFDEAGALREELTSFTRWLRIENVSPPVVTLVGAAEVTIECGDEDWVEPGILAVDSCEEITAENVGRWIWAFDGTADKLVVEDGAPRIFEQEEMIAQPGRYVLVYVAFNSLDVSNVPVFGDPEQPQVFTPDFLLRDPEAVYLRRVTVRDTRPPVIKLEGEQSMEVLFSLDELFVDPGVSAADVCEGSLPADRIAVNGRVNRRELGHYSLTYSVSDSYGNTAHQTRTVHVRDPYLPTITLIDPPAPDEDLTIECGSAFYDPGATAHDGMDGDLTERIEISGFDPAIVNGGGVMVITYSVRNSRGSRASVSRTVVVLDSLPPILTLNGSTVVEIDCHATYRDAGVASAVDQCDGDLRDRVQRRGTVDTNISGEQFITYSVTDNSGNVESVTRTVIVRDNCVKQTDDEEGEPIEEGEGEGEAVVPPDDEDAGCFGCGGSEDSGKGIIDSLRRKMSDILLVGVSLLTLALFAARRS